MRLNKKSKSTYVLNWLSPHQQKGHFDWYVVYLKADTNIKSAYCDMYLMFHFILLDKTCYV